MSRATLGLGALHVGPPARELSALPHDPNQSSPEQDTSTGQDRLDANESQSSDPREGAADGGTASSPRASHDGESPTTADGGSEAVVRKLTLADAKLGLEWLGTQEDSRLAADEIRRVHNVQMHLRGHELVLEGTAADCDAVEAGLAKIVALSRAGRPIAAADLGRALELVAREPRLDLAAVFDDVIIPRVGHSRGIAPRSLAQKRYVDALRRQALVFGVGPAGTGKTYLAMAMAVRRLMERQVRRIVLTRPAIEAGENLGFLPGTLEDKVSPYMRPLYDALFDMLEGGRVQKMIEAGAIEIAPLAYMRGRTLHDSFVILDEAQNATRDQMKMFLTRIGRGTWCVVAGDPSQIDLPSGQRSGLPHALTLLRDVEGISICRFSDVDVMRHPLVQAIVRAYDKDEQRRAAQARRDRPEVRYPRDGGESSSAIPAQDLRGEAVTPTPNGDRS